MGMITVFEKIPDPFVAAYDAQFRAWAAEFRVRGRKCAIVFDRPPGAPALLDETGRVMAKGAWLVAEFDRSRPQEPRMVIRPADEFAEELIAQHVREMRAFWFH